MSLLTFIGASIAVHLLAAGLVWGVHRRAYYELERRVEARLGPVREFPDVVGEYSLTTGGLIPRLRKIEDKYGDELASDELALLRKSRVCYYVSGIWGILILIGVVAAAVFMNMNDR